jgi:hypothetical protein
MRSFNLIDITRKELTEEEKTKAIFDMMKEIQSSLEGTPTASLGKEEVRYMVFTGKETLPSGYERANGQRGTYSIENGNIEVIPIQKVK